MAIVLNMIAIKETDLKAQISPLGTAKRIVFLMKMMDYSLLFYILQYHYI